MKYDGKDGYTFDSGRAAYANCGIIGIQPSLDISDGYDGGFDTKPSHNEYIYGEEATPFTPAERAELADYMIALWTAFKTAGEGGEK